MPDLLISCCKIAGHTYCVVCPSDQLPRAAVVMLRWAVDEGLNCDEVAWSMMMVSRKEKRDGCAIVDGDGQRRRNVPI